MRKTGVLLAAGFGLLLGGAPAQDAVDARGEELRPLLASLSAPVFDARGFLALCESGTRAVPRLLAIVSAGDETTPEAARARTRALRALRFIGAPAADLAVPALLTAAESYTGGNYRDLARTVLVLYPLTTDPAAHADAVNAQIGMGRTATRGGKANATGRDHLSLLLDAMRCFARRDSALRTKLEHAVAELGSDNPLVREYAAECIGRRGSDAAIALDALRTAVTATDHPRSARFRSATTSANISRDFSEGIADAASIAIARVAPADPLARRGHALLLDSDDPRERVVAAMSLSPPTDDCVDVTDELLAATHDDDPLVAGEAVTALGRACVPSDRARKRLAELVAEGGALGARATVALKRLEPSEGAEGRKR